MPAKKRRHTLIIHTVPMKSAKTLHLIQTYLNAQTAKRTMQAFRPLSDTRHPEPVICTRFGNVCVAATLVETSADLLKALLPTTKLVLIDEGQFFDDGLPKVIERLLEQADVSVAGLDLDYRAQPFGTMPQLMAMADTVNKYTPVCDICGEPARFTQRLTNGRPSRATEPAVVAEGSVKAVTYQSRCHACYKVPR